MAQILFRYKNNFHPDPEVDRRGSFKKGYISSIKEDGWYEGNPNWSQSAYADKTKWFVLSILDATKEEISMFCKPWYDNYDYRVISSQPAQGRYVVEIFETNISTSDKNAITQNKIERYLIKWGCLNYSYTTNSAQFTFSLWNAVRSEAFWELDFTQISIDFVLLSYSADTGIGRIQVTVPTVIKPKVIRNKIINRGGVIVSEEHPIYVFDIERSDILQRFRQDVKMKAEKLYKVRRYYLTEEQSDIIHNAGGFVEMTKAEFLSLIKDGLSE